MGELKIRKIGNSIGAIFPKEWQLEEGDVIEYSKDEDKIILNTEDLNKKHDRDLIEESFADFEQGLYVTEEEMAEEFGDDGWGK